MPESPVVVWFRNDLRIADNPALTEAARTGAPVLAVFIHDEASDGLRPLGGALRWWLHHSLASLDADLRRLGCPLLIVEGPARMVLERLRSVLAPKAVLWNRRYEAAAIAVDSEIKSDLKAAGVRVETFNGALLYEPWTVKSKGGTPIKVYTPFWRAARASAEIPPPLPAPARLPGASVDTEELGARPLDALRLLPTKPDWAGGLRRMWRPGEAGALARLEAFLEEGFLGYGEGRNRPDLEHTSRLSPHLRFGEIGPRQIWAAAEKAAGAKGKPASLVEDLAKLQSELGWRDFAYHLLFHNPDLASRNFQPKFDEFDYRSAPKELEAWRRGRTGYPIVDAGMRQLWETGWMHNRVRMIVASFLVKHLLVDWREGESWFWDTLVDADPANNPTSWQWVAGSGADAAPFYRIFNPILQGERFDPDGVYVRRFVPELAALDTSVLHKPWTASPAALKAAGVELGVTYPAPIVDHDGARARALDALKNVKPKSV